MKKQSPIQQELLRRRSSKNIPYPPLHQTATPHVPSPAVPQNGLRRRSSISPAARDFVPLSASSYGSALNRKKALIIGIGYADHKHLAPVPGARNDVRDMFYLLTGELFGFQESDVSVLCDELDQIGSVAASAPTRINILREMKCLTEGIKAGDSVVFFFAGHGEAVEDTSGDEIETGVDQVGLLSHLSVFISFLSCLYSF